ncbi:hypothetical protein IGI04_041988 [Brassica rapa subsp. trilocularis]|uniref:RAP release 2, galactose-binding-like domain protein n=1 Tax=Brassica rapa subsp. trilocularis TaxID=1813537 RepID=A0ABQ7KSE9_BRACM|nr:hypothetical protein IGI04_041988 [Brassica rapa subsp. trilocularis]
MALSSASLKLTSLSFSAKKTNRNPRNRSLSFTITCSSSFDEPPKPSLTSSSSTPNRVSSSSAPKARFVARQKQSVSVRQLQRPLIEYMSLPASQYSVLDAERIERVDDNTFRCYVYTFKFFNFEVCPVLLVRVEEQPNGCCIKLLSCKLEGSPVVVAQNDKFDASMVNRVSCDGTQEGSLEQQITSDAVIEVVNIEIPFAFRVFPVGAIEATGTQVLDQILRLMLPRFLSQLSKDYQAWASGDTSRQPLGTGEI